MNELAIEQAKTKHWEDMASQASIILSFWDNYWEAPRPVSDRSKDRCIIDDPQFELIDGYLANALVTHLKAEFEEFQGIGTWAQLVNTSSIRQGLQSKLALIKRRRTFEGACELCPTSTNLTRMLTQQAVSAYLELHKNPSPSTRGIYSSLLNRLEKKFPYLPTEPEPLEQFISQFTHDRTRYNYFKILLYFYRWVSQRFGVPNPTDKMSVPRVRKKVVPSLSKEELQGLFSQPLSPRDYAVLRILSGCGLRVGEAINLKFGDIGQDRLTVRGKTGERIVPLTAEIRDTLLALRDGHKLDDSVFWGIHPTQPLGHAGFLNIVRTAFKNAGIEGKRASPHTLRHSFGRNWITGGGDTVSLKNILGHSSLATTQQYVDLSAEDLVSKNQQFNPLISLVDDIISTDGDSISGDDDSISAPDQQLSLCYTIVK